jgi:hypothetical protein
VTYTVHVVDMARTKQSARRDEKNPPKFAKIAELVLEDPKPEDPGFSSDDPDFPAVGDEAAAFAWLHRTDKKPPKMSWKAWTNKTGQTKPFPEWVFSVKKPSKISWERWDEAQEKLALAQNKKPKQ